MKLGPYDVVREVGRGGMGVVFQGRAPDGRNVALKCLLTVSRGDALARFDRERRLLSSLGDEEGFVSLLDFGDTPRGPYIVMPFVGGGTLRARMGDGALPVAETVELAKTLCHALAKAHAQGIVHRDLKPENILFTDDGRPLVSDLGLAKHFNRDTPGASQSIALSAAGEVRGTAGYMAPEQMDPAGGVGPAADVFALGAIIYECLTGDPAFEGDNMAEMLGRVVSGNWTPIRTKRPEVPKAIARVVERALSAQAEHRYPDAGAFARALEGKEDKAPARSRRGLVAALVALSALGAGAAALLSFRPGVTVAQPSGTVTPGGSPTASKEPSRAKLVATWGSTEWRHEGPVLAVAFAPDGKLGASASADRTIKLWDLATGRAQKTLEGHADAVTGIAFTPDGKRLASTSADGTVRVWELATGKPVWTADEKPDQLRGLAISGDGKRVATCGGVDHVMLYATANGEAATMRESDMGRGNALVFVPGGELLVVATEDGALRPLTLQFGMAGDVLRGHAGAVTCIAAMPDGQAVVTGGEDRTIRVRNPKGGDLAKLVGHDDVVTGVAITPDGKRILSSSADRTLRVWDLAKAAEVKRLEGHAGPVLACAISLDGRRALSGGADNTVRLWDLNEERPLSRIDGHLAGVTGVAILPDQHRAVSCGLDGQVCVWDATSGKLVQTLLMRIPKPLTAIALIPENHRPLAACSNASSIIFDYELGTEWRSYSNKETGTAAGLAVLAPQNKFIGLFSDGKLRKYDLAVEKMLNQEHAHVEGMCVAASRDGRRAATGGAEGRIILWDTEARPTQIADVGSLTTPITSVALAADGKTVVSGSADGVISVWDVTAKERFALVGHEGPVRGLAFARSERAVISVAADGVRAWDLERKRPLDRIEICQDEPLGVAVFQDGRSFLVGTKRGLIFRYELEAEK